jgi:hypothetical protein
VIIERILHIADLIEKLEPQQFDMNEYITENECGTVACIAGWTYLTYGEASNIGDPHESAAIHLALDTPSGQSLFIPTSNDGLPRSTNYANITPAHAAQTLRKLAETGKVDWSHVS